MAFIGMFTAYALMLFPIIDRIQRDYVDSSVVNVDLREMQVVGGRLVLGVWEVECFLTSQE